MSTGQQSEEEGVRTAVRGDYFIILIVLRTEGRDGEGHDTCPGAYIK